MSSITDGLSIVLGTRKGLIILQTDSDRWSVRSTSHLGIPIPYAFVDERHGTLWASLDHGHWGQKLQRSPDFGGSWQEIEAPKYPEGAMIKDDTPAVMRYLWVIQPGAANEPGKMYVGTEPGGLFVSDDGGDHFQINAPLWDHPSRPEHWFGGGRDYAGIHSIVVDPRDHRRLFIGISCAGVFESTDGGASWSPKNKGLRADYLPNPDAEIGHDPHLLVQCATKPDVMWQQNHCGIFKTDDAGTTWHDVTQKDGPAKFGFAVAVDHQNPDVAWVVPGISDECRTAIDGAMCVCRTDDGGQSWQAYRNGLPQRECYDIVFRHALDVHGDIVAMGTTTGNVFLSHDRGESWQCLGHYFPPVYSVRFARH